MNETRHENYELLNLIGYGLAKFNIGFVKEFGFKTKAAFYNYVIGIKIAETSGTIKNRQDLFDPFFDNGRKGWWQRGNTYLHRKTLIDSLFGTLDVVQFADIVKIYIEDRFGIPEKSKVFSPIIKSKFKQLQITGREAELYFVNNYQNIQIFENGILDGARLYGDGYDFQVKVSDKYFLAEIKGVKTLTGSIRLTENEFQKASEYKDAYGLVVVSNLVEVLKMTAIFNPVNNLRLSKKVVAQSQAIYHSEVLSW